MTVTHPTRKDLVPGATISTYLKGVLLTPQSAAQLRPEFGRAIGMTRCASTDYDVACWESKTTDEARQRLADIIIGMNAAVNPYEYLGNKCETVAYVPRDSKDVDRCTPHSQTILDPRIPFLLQRMIRGMNVQDGAPLYYSSIDGVHSVFTMRQSIYAAYYQPKTPCPLPEKWDEAIRCPASAYLGLSPSVTDAIKHVDAAFNPISVAGTSKRIYSNLSVNAHKTLPENMWSSLGILAMNQPDLTFSGIYYACELGTSTSPISCFLDTVVTARPPSP